MKAKPPAPAASVKWDSDPLTWTRSGGHADQLLVAIEVRKKRRRRRRIASAGGAAVLLFGLFLFLAFPRPVSEPMLVPSGKALVTVPERRTLPDGSTVEFKPGAEITVSFSPELRRVALIKGEALFQVAKNPNRPFVVEAGGIRFRAVGTAFNVSLGSTSVEMLVTEGRVAVERPLGLSLVDVPQSHDPPSDIGPLSSEITVDAGNRVVVEIAQPVVPAIIPTTAIETGEKLAWRVPRLEFNETPLWEVVSMLNQYSGARISLANSELGRVEISGALRADNIEPLLQTLEANYQIQVVRRPSGEIELKQDR